METRAIHIQIPIELHGRLKAAAALAHKSVKDAVTEAVADWIQKEGQ